MTKKWAAFPYPDKAYAHDAAGLKKSWPRLHRGDCEPLPKDSAVLDAWRHYHAGAFAAAVEAGRKAGGAGQNAAVKAQMIYANYLEKSDKAKLALLQEAAEWADARRHDGGEGRQRALPLRVRAGPLQPGHLDRQGAGAGVRRQDQGGADHRDQARTEARGRAHRLRLVSGRGHRQGRRPDGGCHVRREEGVVSSSTTRRR